jgi:hypothetical protein
VAVGVDAGVWLGDLVGRGVGVERSVGWAVGCDVADWVGFETGVGPSAICGDVAEGDGTSLGDELGIGSTGVLGEAVALDAGGEIEPAGWFEGVAAVALAAATGPGGVGGATRLAVRATVARMRFSTPIATTRRARCAVVTVSPRLLDLVERVRSADGAMVAEGSARRPRRRLACPEPLSRERRLRA